MQFKVDLLTIHMETDFIVFYSSARIRNSDYADARPRKNTGESTLHCNDIQPFGGISGCTISLNAGNASQCAAWAFNEG